MPIGLNGYLGNATDGLFFRDWQHAARLYVDDTYRLAPKPKWLFYAVFNINDVVLTTEAFRDQNRKELNYLVKEMDLPRYTLETEKLNQYNRKTTTYTKISYDPVNITFHDDNNGVTNAMWALYYGYYFADRLNSASPYVDINPPAYRPHTYDVKDRWPYRYGLDNDISEPFFTSIQLITLSQHKFTSYLLCNPKITSWQHDTMDQSEGNGMVENKMSVIYDAVIYTTGIVSVDNPTGFGYLHYDQMSSPLNNQFQRTYNTVPSPLYSNNSFNPIDAGISLLASVAANPFVGNRLPYGYGGEIFNSPTYSPYSTSGFQNYNFGSSGTLRSALDNTAKTIKPVQSAPIDSSFTTGAQLRADAINSQYADSLKDNTTDQAIITDVYKSNLPKDQLSSNESQVFGRLNSGKPLPEAPGAVDIDYFIENDVPSNSFTLSELVNNNPQAPNLPEDPFD